MFSTTPTVHYLDQWDNSIFIWTWCVCVFSVLYLLWWKLNSLVRCWCRGGEGQLIQRRVDSHHGTTETHLSRKHIIYLNTVHRSPHTHTHTLHIVSICFITDTHTQYMCTVSAEKVPPAVFSSLIQWLTDWMKETTHWVWDWFGFLSLTLKPRCWKMEKMNNLWPPLLPPKSIERSPSKSENPL